MPIVSRPDLLLQAAVDPIAATELRTDRALLLVRDDILAAATASWPASIVSTIFVGVAAGPALLLGSGGIHRFHYR
jgi:hypothetical protein